MAHIIGINFERSHSYLFCFSHYGLWESINSNFRRTIHKVPVFKTDIGPCLFRPGYSSVLKVIRSSR